MFLDYNELKLQINSRRKFGKLTNACELNHKLINNQCVNEKS